MIKEFKLKGFPNWDNLTITEFGIIDKNGELITCEEIEKMSLIKWKAAFYDRGKKPLIDYK